MRWLLRLYHRYELWAKLSGVLVFLVVIASLYFFVLASPKPGSGPALAQATPSPTVPAPSVPPDLPTVTVTPGPSPSPTPPLLPPRYQVREQTNLDYESASSLDERFDICSPVGATGPRPGVILLHDIGTQVDDKVVYAGLCSLLASQGFVAVAINFRKYPNVWPDQLEDAQLAVRYLRAHASAYQLDPARLCALGSSAGGHLALLLGVLGTNYPGDKATLLTTESPRVSCVVDEFGMVDLPRLDQNTTFWPSAFDFLFGPNAVENNPTLLIQASPIHYVSAQSAPTLIVQGTLDTIVPPDQSQELQQALQRDNVPVSYLSYIGQHNFDGMTPQQIGAINVQIIAYLTNQEHP